MSDFDEGLAVGLAIGRKKFSGGDTPSEKKWEYPSDWLPLPEVGENEVAALIFVMAGASASVGFNGEAPESVDWGDPNGDYNPDYTISHSYAYDRGATYSSKASMFVLKAHYAQECGFGSFYTNGGCFIAACAVNGSAIRQGENIGTIVSTFRDYLQYIKITGDMTNFDERTYFIAELTALKRVDFENSPTKLTSNMFSECYCLTSANLPDMSDVTSVGDNCFQDCCALSEIRLPALQTAGNDFCMNCYELKKIYMPALVSVGDYCFENCRCLVSVGLPNLETVGGSGLNGCYGLESADMPSLSTVSDNKIGNYCYSLREINMPNIDITQSGIFPQSYMIKQKTTEEEST